MPTPAAGARLVLRSRRVLAGSELVPADVVVAGGAIERIAAYGAVTPAAAEATSDLGDLVLQPGLIDPHVHLDDPGRADWEGFEHGTRAAAAGGITFVADMPLNSDPVTTDPEAVRQKCAAAEKRCFVDVGLHGGLVPSNARDPRALEALLDTGVLALKAFLCDSGLPEFPPVDRRDLEAAMPLLAKRGATLLVHAELPTGSPQSSHPHRYAAYLATRPPRTEVAAIELLVELCRRTGCPVHVVHLSTAYALPLLARAKAEGLPLTVETCPHYLVLCAEQIEDGDTRCKCAPPIRARENRERLWAALMDGTIDLVASDHSPCPPARKALLGEPRGDFALAWGGISSLQLALPLLWTGLRERGLPLERTAQWLSAAPARLLALEASRGAIAPGLRADLVAWDPEASFVVDARKLYHRHPITPYHGHVLHGVVRSTWLAGRCVFRDGAIAGEPIGSVVLRLERDESVQPIAGHASLVTRDLETWRALLHRCCGSARWVELVAAAAPFATAAELHAAAEGAFERLERADWLEAFAHHPRIGDLDALRAKHPALAATAELSAREQAGAAGAADDVLRALAAGNRAYEERFGHVFLVCATGKSASEMLALLETRLGNEPANELRIAAAEQRKITRIRIDRLLDADGGERAPSQ